MSNNPSTQIDPPASGLGPGERLQAARISLGLTLDDVANRMHLSPAILSSLEENHFEEITAPIFVKGYLRSYARIVNVSEDEIIQQYASYCPDCDPPITSTSNTTADLNADDSRIKWFTWIVILGLFIALVIWWWDRYQQPAETLSLDTSDSSETIKLVETESMAEEVPVIPATEENIAVGQDENEALTQQVQNDLAVLNQNPTANTKSSEINPEVDSKTLVNETQQQSEDIPARPVTVNESDETSLTIPDEEVEAVEEKTEATVLPKKGLVITVNADTWTDVRDAAGNKLVYDLLRSGETVTVDAKGPLRAFFGNGYGVSMVYQGEEIDLSAVIKPDNTAKIRLGQ